MIELIARIEALNLAWRVSSPDAMGIGTRAEGMVRSPGGQWIFGYGADATAALSDALAKWEAGK